jgi:hypothetical protein
MNARTFVRWSVAGSAVATFVALRCTGLSLAVDGIGLRLPLLVFSSLTCAQIYRQAGNVALDRLVYGLEGIGLFSIITVIGAVATYPMAALSAGWVDRYLIAADKLIGLDWMAYWTFVQARPTLGSILHAGYMSIFITPLMLLGLLSGTGHIDRCYRFIAAFIIALVITDLSLILFPAQSAEAYFLGTQAPGLPESGIAHIPIIEGLRNGSIKVVDLTDMKGLIAIPSFHAAACAIFVWASWPVRVAKFISLGINAILLLSTPLVGGHYFVDILVGILVGICAIMTSNRLFTVSAATANVPVNWDVTIANEDRPPCFQNA